MADGDDGWSGERVARWVRQSAGLERQLAPVQELLLAAAALQPGERVLDVGCGTGPTTRAAAAAVGPAGRLTGLDIAAEMLAAAAHAGSSAQVEWVCADATAWAGPVGYDAVLSRFGVMFFDDPAAAFANLARLTRPGGRLAVAVWGRRDASALFEVPLQAAVIAVRAAGGTVEVPPVDVGPFSLSDVSATQTLVSDAGWSSVRTAVHDLALPFGGGLPPSGAAEVALDFGPTRLVTTGLADDVRRAVLVALQEAFEQHVDADGHVLLPARVHVVTAVRP